MNIERQIVVEVVGNILVSDLSLNAVDIINRMHELILIHGDSVFLDIDDEGCYSGFISIIFVFIENRLMTNTIRC